MWNAAETGARLGTLRRVSPARRTKADDGARTHDPQLGKLMLYQLSYVRVLAGF